MSVFGDYAQYYDLFYADKDYAAEAKFVSGLLKSHSPKARSLIELGCGTARHALELVRGGYSVHGIDRSAQMVEQAQAAAVLLPAKVRNRLTAGQGDVTTYAGNRTYDAALSLFHVVNYQTTNAALAAVFRTARSALQPGGCFVFDFWYGPAVLSDRPAVRIKRASTKDTRVTRLAEPVLHPNQNIVDVHYTLLVEHIRTKRLKEFKETHSMRYLFLPEMEMLAAAAGLEILKTGEWMSTRPLSDRTWLGWAVAHAA